MKKLKEMEIISMYNFIGYSRKTVAAGLLLMSIANVIAGTVSDVKQIRNSAMNSGFTVNAEESKVISKWIVTLGDINKD